MKYIKNNNSSNYSCEFCKLLSGKNDDITYVGDGKVSSIFLNFNQNYKGRCLLLLNEHYDSIDQVPTEMQQYFWDDMMVLYQVILRALKPSKINIALLGNKISHVHWHLIPRYQDEDNFSSPPWPSKRIKLDDNNIYKIKKILLDNMKEARDERKDKKY